MPLDLQGTLNLLIAVLGGAAIGMEREWSGHATGPDARFAGVRTFTLLGLLAGLAGVFWHAGLEWLSAILVAGAVGLVLIAYWASSQKDVGGTTEIAALVVIAAGLLAGMGNGKVASGIFAGTALLLVEKSRLHSWVEKIPGPGFLAGIRFAVMALVVLPLLPEGPFGPWGGVKPRTLWMLVLFFSSMSFAGYIARSVAGPGRGYMLMGLIGGLISSTNVTWTFSRLSGKEKGQAAPLAIGVVAACTVMFFRVLTALTVLAPPLAISTLPYLAGPAAIGVVMVAIGFWRTRVIAEKESDVRNPLELGAALQMAVLFQAVLYAIHWVKQWGGKGMVASGAVLGLTDMDALTVSMSQMAGEPVARTALLAGILANGVLKLAVAAGMGAGRYRLFAGIGLSLLAAASAVALLWSDTGR